MKLGRIEKARAAITGLIETESARTLAARLGIMLDLAGYPGGVPERDMAVLLSGPATPGDRFLAGASAARHGNWEDVRLVEGELEAAAATAAAHGDSLASADLLAYVSALRGYAALQRDDAATAVRELEAALPRLPGMDVEAFTHEILRIELGRAMVASGRPDRAEPYLQSREFYGFLYTSLGEYYLGQLYERQGDADRARHHYGRFVNWWEGCDPELEPLREEGRRALVRLAGDRAD